MLDTPTGIPFLYEKLQNGSYSRTLATSRKDYSWQALDYINFMGNTKFRNYTMRSVINGEKKITTPEGVFRVDGYCETPEGRFCLEFYGCRERLKLNFLNFNVQTSVEFKLKHSVFSSYH